jgi:DNA-binding NarL/FixJ family response regulator
MQVVLKAKHVRVGLVSTEPIRAMGFHSFFEDHASILMIVDDIDTLLSDSSLGYLILDLSCSADWMATQSLVKELRPDIRLIIVGPTGDEEFALSSIAAGARAYLDPNCGPLAVRQAVETVIQGSIWANRRVLSLLVDRLLSQPVASVPRPSMPRPDPAFSPRERQVLDLIMKACSNREISVELGIEERTVKAYVASLMRKTGMDNRVSLSVQATQVSMREQRSLTS